MNAKKEIIIVNLIDWSESFVDENGSFYCGTTEEQKQRASKIVSHGDLVINNIDLHPVTAPEHAVNGGLYPVHNAILPEQFGPDFIYMITQEGEELRLGAKTVSPRLTKLLSEAVAARSSGIVVPRDVYFQGGTDNPFCSSEDIEATFSQKIIDDKDFLNEDYGYITAPKKYFDATRSDSDITLPKENFPGIPVYNFNIYSLVKLKYPENEYEITMINTGVVEGICRLHTSIGLRQMFPLARIINISDATTPLFGVGLGYRTAEESRKASMQVCRDVGIDYMTAQECLEEFSE